MADETTKRRGRPPKQREPEEKRPVQVVDPSEDTVTAVGIYPVGGDHGPKRFNGTDRDGWIADFMLLRDALPKWLSEEQIQRAARLYARYCYLESKMQLPFGMRVAMPSAAADLVIDAFNPSQTYAEHLANLSRLEATEVDAFSAEREAACTKRERGWGVGLPK